MVTVGAAFSRDFDWLVHGDWCLTTKGTKSTKIKQNQSIFFVYQVSSKAAESFMNKDKMKRNPRVTLVR